VTARTARTPHHGLRHRTWPVPWRAVSSRIDSDRRGKHILRNFLDGPAVLTVPMSRRAVALTVTRLSGLSRTLNAKLADHAAKPRDNFFSAVSPGLCVERDVFTIAESDR